MSRALLPLMTVAGLLLAGGSLRAQPAKAEPKKAKKIAVLIGVNEYQNKPFVNLKYAEQDMTDLKGKLEQAGFTVVLLLGSAGGEQEASRANIAATLIDTREENRRFAFRDVTSEDDQVLVAFSGHGEQIEVEEDDGAGRVVKREVPHFCPKRAETGKPSTQVSLNAVLRTFDGGKAKALLLVDACRVYSANREGTKGAIIDRKRVDALRPNVGGMFAASDRQAAREHDKVKHGLFFHAVLQAIESEKCRDKDGNVVWSRMTDEVADAVAAKSMELFPTLKDDEHQVPQPFGGFPRKFVLATRLVRPSNTDGNEPNPQPNPNPNPAVERVTISKATAGYRDPEENAIHPDWKVIRSGTKATVLDRDEKRAMFQLKLEDGAKVWVRQDCCTKDK